jgi:hypothetical protein
MFTGPTVKALVYTLALTALLTAAVQLSTADGGTAQHNGTFERPPEVLWKRSFGGGRDRGHGPGPPGDLCGQA